MSDDRHEGPDRTSPYPISRLAPKFDLAHVEEELSEATQLLGVVNRARLEVIAKQIKALQEEARDIIDKAEHDLLLHQADIKFKRRVGCVYHLYRRPNGSTYMSMLSPAEWGEPPHDPMGSYRLEADGSWTRVKQ